MNNLKTRLVKLQSYLAGMSAKSLTLSVVFEILFFRTLGLPGISATSVDTSFQALLLIFPYLPD